MPNLPARASGRLPAGINRQIARQEAGAAIAVNQDALRIRRTTQATHNGLVGIAEIGAHAAARANQVPWMARHLEAAAEAGAITIIGHIYDTRY